MLLNFANVEDDKRITKVQSARELCSKSIITVGTYLRVSVHGRSESVFRCAIYNYLMFFAFSSQIMNFDGQQQGRLNRVGADGLIRA